jgi:hypothetical protein
MDTKILLYSCVACGVGVAMIITGLLPQDKMDKVRALLGDRKELDDRRKARMQLLVCGVFFLFIGLVVLGVIRP